MTPTKKDGSSVLFPNSSERTQESQLDDIAAPDLKLDDAAQALIGHHLRSLYGQIVKEPVPDQFLKLLQDLERKEQE